MVDAGDPVVVGSGVGRAFEGSALGVGVAVVDAGDPVVVGSGVGRAFEGSALGAGWLVWTKEKAC